MITVNKKLGRINIQFNPSFYKTAYNAYQEGDYKKIITMMKESAADSHVAGCLIGRRAGFQRNWSIEPYEESEVAEQRAEYLTKLFKRLNIRQLFKDIIEAVLYKYVVIAFEWEIIDGKQGIVKHKKFDQKYFKYDPDDTDTLKIDFGKRLDEIPEDALICETEEMPVMLPVLRDYILKEYGLHAWASFIETFGEALIIGKYPSGVDDEFKTQLKAGLDAIASSSRGIVPDTADIEFEESNRTTGDHKDFTAQSDKGISIAVLGHAQAVEETSGMKVGDNQTPYEVRKEIAIDDIYFIESCMNKLIDIIESKNYNDGNRSVFTIDKSRPIDAGERLKIIDSAYDKGMIIDPQEYALLGLKVSPDQEPLVKPVNPFEF